jgi:hypothetical protein
MDRSTKMLRLWELQAEYEKLKEFRKWQKEMPYLTFKPHWQVKVIPPFAGAVARFVVKDGESTVSVYFDVDDTLGYVGEPYWEIYPDKEGDNARFLMNETDELIQAISDSLESRHVD